MGQHPRMGRRRPIFLTHGRILLSASALGGDPRGVRVEWRNGGGRTRLVGVTKLSRMLGTNPNLALLVLEGLGRWESGRSAEGMDPQRKGWARLRDRGGDDSNSSSSSSSSGGKTPPTKAPKTPPRPPRKSPAPATSRVATKKRRPPHKPKPKAKPQAKGKGKATPPPPNPRPPLCKIGAGTPMGMCRLWGTPGMSLGRRGAMGGPSAK